MKNALMVVSTWPIINIGDYIQALAARQFVGKTDIYIERERLKQYDGEEVKMIMNGWYMIEPQNFPPSDKIKPLFVSFHINSLAKEAMMNSQETIEYLKRHQPIGCRDKATEEMLIQKGVDAYYSGCLTLTLGNIYSANEKEEKVYFVDPWVPLSRNSIKSMLSNFLYLMLHYRKCRKLFDKFKAYKQRSGMWLVAAAFYRVYHKYFSDELLFNAEYIDQESPEIAKKYPTNDDKFAYAEELLRKYAKAQCVVTSRIHCALPCLSMGTPVLYVERGKQSETSKCRLDGLRDLLNVVYGQGGALDMNGYGNNGKITVDNFPANKECHLSLKKNLEDICTQFVNND